MFGFTVEREKYQELRRRVPQNEAEREFQAKVAAQQPAARTPGALPASLENIESVVKELDNLNKERAAELEKKGNSQTPTTASSEAEQDGSQSSTAEGGRTEDVLQPPALEHVNTSTDKGSDNNTGNAVQPVRPVTPATPAQEANGKTQDDESPDETIQGDQTNEGVSKGATPGEHIPTIDGITKAATPGELVDKAAREGQPNNEDTNPPPETSPSDGAPAPVEPLDAERRIGKEKTNEADALSNKNTKEDTPATIDLSLTNQQIRENSNEMSEDSGGSSNAGRRKTDHNPDIIENEASSKKIETKDTKTGDNSPAEKDADTQDTTTPMDEEVLIKREPGPENETEIERFEREEEQERRQQEEARQEKRNRFYAQQERMKNANKDPTVAESTAPKEIQVKQERPEETSMPEWEELIQVLPPKTRTCHIGRHFDLTKGVEHGELIAENLVLNRTLDHSRRRKSLRKQRRLIKKGMANFKESRPDRKGDRYGNPMTRVDNVLVGFCLCQKKAYPGIEQYCENKHLPYWRSSFFISISKNLKPSPSTMVIRIPLEISKIINL